MGITSTVANYVTQGYTLHISQAYLGGELSFHQRHKGENHYGYPIHHY